VEVLEGAVVGGGQGAVLKGGRGTSCCWWCSILWRGCKVQQPWRA
jgi:hypothetical protein